ncbi:MAG: GNAT family N-acetyltransferase [Planctomycetaceae bacterium]|nr:GNAT family N-acetyltransferase [Planctomycetaceae bacterium]
MTSAGVRFANLADPADDAAIVEILDAYAAGPMGQGRPLSDDVRRQLVAGLNAHPTAFVLLACVAGRPVGLAVCFEGFSTFAAKPLINVHDLAVLPEFRNQGLGRQLLEAVADVARERGCCKVTLEVRGDNESAKRLYERCGFGPWDDVTLFVAQPL